MASSVPLNDLLPQLDLAGIDACFSEEEVWATIRELPSDRARGPDSFSGLFYKVAWPIIKQDLMNAFAALWSLDARSFYLLNDALMILLLKNDAPTRLKDYRPISLMHSFSKLFAKCLARHLAPRLKEIVAPNQSAFIKDRSIHDNFKAFDSIAWPFLIEVLLHIGFPRRWVNWITILLSSASTKVLVNGKAGRRIAHARGLRQRDPISPMLFVIVMEALNSLFTEADRRLVLTPLLGQVIAHRASLYADDLVLLVAPNTNDLRSVLQILQLFAGASGLVTNVDKCVAMPIRFSAEVMLEVQQAFPCVVAQFPCRYLGAPLSLSRLRRADEQPLVDAVAARLPTWKAGLLTHSGRVLLTRVTLSAIPVHVNISCCLSK